MENAHAMMAQYTLQETDAIRIMIVEDNKQLAESIRTYFVKKSDIDVIGIAFNSIEAMLLLKNETVDIIIMDLVMPQSDGFVLLEYINSVQFDKKPQVIVLSAVSHEAIIKHACELGAIYYMVKPFAMEMLYERVKDIIRLRSNNSRKAQSFNNEQHLEEKIASVLLSIGILSRIRGYQYLCEAIKMVVLDPELINSITKKLYPNVGCALDTSAANVERGIRLAIDQAWESGRLENVNDLFGCKIISKNYRPTNGEFIALIANKLQRTPF